MFVLGTSAMAHPHHYTDQQASLTLGPEGAAITLAIMPSVAEGPRLATMLDADGDGNVSVAEADGFADGLAAAVVLSVDGAAVPLVRQALEIPPLTALSAANAGLRLQLDGRVALLADGAHQITLTISDDRFGGTWFIQPYFAAEFAGKAEATAIERPETGGRIDLTLTPLAGKGT